MGGFTKVNIFMILLMLTTLAMISSQKIHEEMTPDERATTFLTHNNEIPDYQVVPIHWPRYRKRDTRGYAGVSLTAFGKHIKLWLNPVEGVLAGDEMPIYNAKSSVGGVRIGRYNEPMKYMKVRMYEDLAKATTLVVNPANRHNQGRHRISGVIGSENLVVRPVPRRLVDTASRHRRSIDGDQLSEDHHDHIVYKRDIKHANPLRTSLQPREIKPRIPNVVYPEILVLVDYDLYEKFRYSIWDIVPYLLGFWNGVDMRFRNLQNPKYRLNIAGIVLPLDAEAFSFVNESMYNNEKLNGLANLEYFGKWLRKHSDVIPLPSYDMAAFMSLRGFCEMYTDGSCGSNIVGQAFTRGACKGNNVKDEIYKVMQIQDLGGFDGIYSAIHELGHALGAHHDGAENSTCLGEHGLIMTASPQYGFNSTTWSECTLSNFTSFLETEPKCLYNVPRQGRKLLRYLPGRIMDADEQCMRIKGTKSYKITSKFCLNLPCISPTDPYDYVFTGSPAADGTSCGSGRICLYGRCLWERHITW